jgi:hypothetical protein
VIGSANLLRVNATTVSVAYHLKGAPPKEAYTVELRLCGAAASVSPVDAEHVRNVDRVNARRRR